MTTIIAANEAKNFTYVDNSNVFLEGRRVSAVQKGLPGAENIKAAMNNMILDYDWHLDYGALHSFACGDPSEIGGASLWGSPPPGDSFWDMVKQHGFAVTKYDRNFAGKEKKVDVAIATNMTRDAYTGLIRRDVDEITLVAGDGDYVPTINLLRNDGFIVHVVFWDHCSRELRDAVSRRDSASRFVSLNPYLDLLTKAWPISVTRRWKE